MSSANVTKRLHISFTPSVPSSSPEDLAKSLTSHLGKFGTVKSVDGLGKLDGVGMPKKFGYISIEGTEGSIAKCVNSLSGSIWKGVKVRVGDAKPDFDQRIAQENAQEPLPPRRKRKRGAVYAEDMSPVTAENATQRSGWKVTEMGRVMRPVRMRPQKPLPPPLPLSSAKKTGSEDKDTKRESAKAKKRRDPDTRSRRRTIDMTRWGSVHLKGIFLEDAGIGTSQDQDEVEAMVEVGQSDLSSDNDSGADGKIPPHVEPKSVKSIVDPPASMAVPAPPPVVLNQNDVDLAEEKNQSLGLLQSLFGGQDGEWGGQESLDSDIDEAELLKIGGTASQVDDGDIEFVPMDVDPAESMREPTPVAPSPKIAPALPPKNISQSTKLKDLFVSRADDAGFSLLGHLDLDLELDEEMTYVVSAGQSEQVLESAVPQLAATLVTSSQTQISLDPRQPLFFPLPTSFSSTQGWSNIKVRQRDVLDVGKDNGWDTGFHRTETDDEIRAKWESGKVELTREWNRRWREAGKVRRRRGGGDGDA